ncbi:MAG TPA: MltA domain-containing protein, partial [Desulfopila sp.]|nr:MltA domain-containing protein [Desulfopila sp.]
MPNWPNQCDDAGINGTNENPRAMLFCNVSRILLLFGLVIMLLGGCSQPRHALFVPSHLPHFHDDSTLYSLQHAITEQRRYLAKLESQREFVIGGDVYTVEWLDQSLVSFQEVIDLAPEPSELNRILRRNYTVYQAGGRLERDEGEMLVTGYYEPLLEGSLTPAPPFVYPLYARPADLVEDIDSKGGKRIGRIDESGEFLSYWTREEIDGSGLLAGYELVYLKDPFDAFLLHVQGSGKIRLQDGSIRPLHYNGNNGHPYTSIGRKLVEDKILRLEEVDTEAIRTYVGNYQSKGAALLNANRRYIFFAWGEGEHPRGSLGVELSPGRSIAIDQSILPAGALGYLVSRRPLFDDH